MNLVITDIGILTELEELEEFIWKLSEKQRKLKRTSVGFFISLQDEEIILAKRLNSLFCKLVWGINNDASNFIIQKDEMEIITSLINIEDNNSILEIGCGSGRITKYLSKFSTDITAIDSEELVINTAIKENPSVSFINVKAHELIIQKKYLKVFVFENMMGQILDIEEREKTIKKLVSITDLGGSLIIGYRVSKYAEINGSSVVQAMPYKVYTNKGIKKLFGLSINWTQKSMLNEFNSWVGRFCETTVIKGGLRPAGGRMYYLINKF